MQAPPNPPPPVPNHLKSPLKLFDGNEMNNMRADDVTKKLDLSDDISSSVPLISSSSNPGAAKLCCISGNKSHQDSTIQQQTDGGN